MRRLTTLFIVLPTIIVCPIIAQRCDWSPVLKYLRMKNLHQALIYACASDGYGIVIFFYVLPWIVEARALSRLLWAGGIRTAWCGRSITGTPCNTFGQRVAYIVQTDCPHIYNDLLKTAAEQEAWSAVHSWVIWNRASLNCDNAASDIIKTASDSSNKTESTLSGLVEAVRGMPLAVDADVKIIIHTKGGWSLLDAWSIEKSRGFPLTLAPYAFLHEINMEPTETSEVMEKSLETRIELSVQESYSSYYLEEAVLSLANIARQNRLPEYTEWALWDIRTRVRRRWNLQSVELRASYYLSQKPRGRGTKRFLISKHAQLNDPFTLHGATMHRIMQKSLNYRWQGVNCKSMGSLVNGTWVGVMGALVMSSQARPFVLSAALDGVRVQPVGADIALPNIAIYPERGGVFDFIGYGYPLELPTVFRQSRRGEESLAMLTRPLEPHTWGVAFVLALTISVILTASVIVERRFKIQPEAETNFLLVFVNVFYLDGPFKSDGTRASRVAETVAAVLGFMVQQFFGGALLAVLLTPAPPLITDLASMLSSDYDYKVEDTSYERLFFQRNAENPEIVRLYQDKISRGSLSPFISSNEGMQRVRAGKFAFQTSAAVAWAEAKKWSDDERCSLDAIYVFPHGQTWQLAAKGTPYSQHFRTAWAQLREHGVWKRETTIWLPQKPNCRPKLRIDPVGGQLKPAFKLYASCGGVSVVILLIELLWNYGMILYDRWRRPKDPIMTWID